ncbi:MAG: bacteriohemerythrin [Thermodesulfobacteriota bacterium]
MSIEWSSGLSTGVEWQDRQHKELFRRINSLLDAMSIGLGKDEVLKLFRFLDEYFVVHFEAEEQAMNRYKFPALITHLSEHMDFIERVFVLEKECAEKLTTSTVIKVQRTVVDWLVHHIGTVDQTLGRFILEAEKDAEAVKEKA